VLWAAICGCRIRARRTVPSKIRPPDGDFSKSPSASSTPPTNFPKNISAPFGLIGQQLQSKAGLGGKGQDSGVAAAVEFVTGMDALGPVSSFSKRLAMVYTPSGFLMTNSRPPWGRPINTPPRRSSTRRWMPASTASWTTSTGKSAWRRTPRNPPEGQGLNWTPGRTYWPRYVLGAVILFMLSCSPSIVIGIWKGRLKLTR